MPAQEALVKISSLHRDAAKQLAATLASAERLEQTVAGVKGMAPAQRVVLDQLNRELLWRLLTIVQKGDVSVIAALKARTPVAQVEIEVHQHLDQLVHLYLQHVQTILRR